MKDARVRMYNVGFGDCFLVTYEGDDRTHRILIDCGSHLSGKGPRTIRQVAAQIVEDVRDDGVPRIDVVVASHRHFDHIAGFDSPVWAEVEVGEVWLPWIEDDKDPAAKRIHDKQVKAALALQAHLDVVGDPAARLFVDNLLSLSNDSAAKTLLSGFKGLPRRRFLPTGAEPETLETSALPGVKIHVLGPSRDEAVIRDMDPPPVQSFLQLMGVGAAAGDDGALDPFPGVGRKNNDRAHADGRIGELHDSLERRGVELAIALEDAVNGTSLVLALEIGPALLLFTGDAQWGTWKAAMGVPAWREVLRRTTFLKIGHHGSHNASPRDLIDGLIPDGIVAMVSVTDVEDWPRIPLEALLSRLDAKDIKWIRSDKPVAGPPFEVDAAGNFIDLTLFA